MTRLLLDENFPRSAASLLRNAGHDVQTVRESAPGISDLDVLALARREQRWLVTFDSDFGDLVFRQGELAGPGVVYLRMDPIVPADAAALTLAALQDDTQGWFVVATPEGLRRRALPRAPANG